MRYPVLLLGAAVLGLLTASGNARADDVTEQIQEGLKSYESGNYGEAIGALNFAVGQIQEKQAAKIKAALPQPLSGWQAEEATGQFAGAALMGGGITASRHYYQDGSDKTVDIEIVTDSPLLQTMAMFLANPALMSSEPGAKLVRIKGYKGVQKFTASDRSGETSLMIQSRMMVTVRGANMDTPDDIATYANAVDYAQLEKYLAK